MLPAVIRVLGLANAGEREVRADRKEELLARRRAIAAAIERLDRLATERGIPHEVTQGLRTRYLERLRHFERAPRKDEMHDQTLPADEIELVLIEAERGRINELYRQGELKDETRRRLERELDLREASVANHQHEE